MAEFRYDPASERLEIGYLSSSSAGHSERWGELEANFADDGRLASVVIEQVYQCWPALLSPQHLGDLSKSLQEALEGSRPAASDLQAEVDYWRLVAGLEARRRHELELGPAGLAA